MKTRFPLSAKILLWFFLNLLLLVAAFYLVLRGQFRFGLDVLITGRSGESIQRLANVIGAEIAARPRAEWDEVLRPFSDVYGVQLAVFHPDGGHVAGPKVELPREVLERLMDRPNPPQRMGNPDFQRNDDDQRGPRRMERSRAFRIEPVERELSDDLAAPPQPESESMPPVQPRAPRPPGVLEKPPGPMRTQVHMVVQRPRFMLRAGAPAKYWVGVPLPHLDPQRPQPPLTLLAISDSLRGGGLFFDYTPWLVTAAAVIVFSVLFWLPLVRGITRSLVQLTRATSEIAEGRFETRLAEGRNDELGVLARAVNRMAERLAGFVSGQKRFLGDTAHELCAPIARMQMALGILEQRATENQKAYVNDVREELQHISGLVNELLSFSKAGLRQQPSALQPVNVAEIATRVVEREGKSGGTVNVHIDESLRVSAEPELLTRALANLVRNALRYAGSAGPVEIAASREGERVTICVRDEGPGVPEDSLQKIFDPFYRIEASRSRDTGGVGLGLAIVKTCVEACGGTVTAHNRLPRGLEVRVTLAVG